MASTCECPSVQAKPPKFKAYSRCTGTGSGPVQGTGPGAMSTDMLYRNVHTRLRQGRDQDPLFLSVLVHV